MVDKNRKFSVLKMLFFVNDILNRLTKTINES